jgi:transposase-like protein
MLTCPHCGEQTTYPFAVEFDRVDAGRFICGHCQKEFFVLDNVTMTKEEYDVKIKIKPKRARAG